MKTPIKVISIARDMQAIKGHDEIWKNTTVCVHRGNKVNNYQTNPIAKKGKISEASVIRAKNAMLKLLADSEP